MLLVVIRIVYAVVCAGAVFAIVQPTSPAPEFIQANAAIAFVVMMLASQIVTLADILFPRKRIDVISAVYFGMLIGWLLSYQLYYALQAFLASAGFNPGAIAAFTRAVTSSMLTSTLSSRSWHLISASCVRA